MLNILGRSQRVCSGWTRRQVLRAGGAGLLGLSLPKLLAAESGTSLRPARAKSVIFMFLFLPFGPAAANCEARISAGAGPPQA